MRSCDGTDGGVRLILMPPFFLLPAAFDCPALRAFHRIAAGRDSRFSTVIVVKKCPVDEGSVPRIAINVTRVRTHK